MDIIDRKIINILSTNARTPLQKIASFCGISAAAVHQRVKKLEEHGVILGTSLVIDHKKVNLKTMAYLGLFLESAEMHGEVIEALKQIPEVVQCSFTTGTYSLFVKIYCHDNTHLMQVLSDKIQGIPGVTRTETFIILKNPISRPVVLEEE